MPRSIFADEWAAERAWERRWDAATPEQRADLFGEQPSPAFPWTGCWDDLPRATRDALMFGLDDDENLVPIFPRDDDLPRAPGGFWGTVGLIWDGICIAMQFLLNCILFLVVYPVGFLIKRPLAFVLVLAIGWVIALLMGANLVLSGS